MTDRTPASPVEVLAALTDVVVAAWEANIVIPDGGDDDPLTDMDSAIQSLATLLGISSYANEDALRAALQAQDHTDTKGGLDASVAAVMEAHDRHWPPPSDAADPTEEWVAREWGVRNEFEGEVRAALEPTHD